MLSQEPSLSILAHNTTHSPGLSLSISLSLSLSLFLSLSHTHTHTHTVPSPLATHPHAHFAAAPWSSHQPSSCVCKTCPPQPVSTPQSPSGDSNSQQRACPARSLPWTHPRRHCQNAPTPSGYRSIWPRTAPAQSGWRNDTWTCPAPSNVLWEQQDSVTLVGFQEGTDVMANNGGCPSTGGPLGLPHWLHRHPWTTTGPSFICIQWREVKVGRGAPSVLQVASVVDWIFPITTLPWSPNQKDTHDSLLSPPQVL